jgi:hypothetical protein
MAGKVKNHLMTSGEVKMIGSQGIGDRQLRNDLYKQKFLESYNRHKTAGKNDPHYH